MGIFDFLGRKKKPTSRRTGAKSIATRRYRAPAVGTSEGGWFPRGGVERAPSALPLIRARARDLAENTPYGSAAIRTIVGHSVGSGLRLGIANDDDYRRAFAAWAGSSDCDYAGQQSLYALQATAVATMAAAGDCLIVLRQSRKKGGLVTQLQLVDPEQIDESAAPKYKGNEVIAGVEVTASGQVVGYHIRKAIDSTLVGSWETEFVFADQAILLFERLYPRFRTAICGRKRPRYGRDRGGKRVQDCPLFHPRFLPPFRPGKGCNHAPKRVQGCPPHYVIPKKFQYARTRAGALA